MTPYLSDIEVSEICAPLKMPAAQRRYLAGLGLVVKAKPNGRPLIARAEFDRVMVGKRLEAQPASPATGPNVVGLNEWAKGRKSHGPKS